MFVDIDLLKKYDRPGPRYTSYPTAPYFHPGIGETDYIRHIKNDQMLKLDEDISLYFHLPFCDSRCYFCGCNMLVSRDSRKIDQYIDYLEKEIKLIRKHIDGARKIAQLHWGGGTPTSLSPDQIRRLGHAIHGAFDFKKEAEVGVEIDPRELTREHMKALRDMGFNRCSMGVQDFDPKVQKSVNRIQSEKITLDAVVWSRELGFKSVNIDLMYGLPFQDFDTFAGTIDKVISFGPDRLAVFNYAHLPRMIKRQKVIKDEWLPQPQEKLKLLKLSIERLTEAGYVYIGMDHFARPEDELTIALNNGTLYRNFQGYSTHVGLNVFALGMSSISMLSDLYVQNHKEINSYYEEMDRDHLPVMRGISLSNDDLLRREIIVNLMCHFKLSKRDIEKKYSISFDQYFADALDELASLQDDGLIRLEKEKLVVEIPGRLLVRNIAMAFDAYLRKKDENKPQFSRTV